MLKTGFVFYILAPYGRANALDVLIQAAGITWERGYSNIRFILIGDGPEKLGLIALVREKGLCNVEFWDPVPKLWLLNFSPVRMLLLCNLEEMRFTDMGLVPINFLILWQQGSRCSHRLLLRIIRLILLSVALFCPRIALKPWRRRSSDSIRCPQRSARQWAGGEGRMWKSTTTSGNLPRGWSKRYWKFWRKGRKENLLQLSGNSGWRSNEQARYE